MTRSENMRRLWADPKFRAHHRMKASASMKARNLKNWQNPTYRQNMTEMLKRRRIAQRESVVVPQSS